MSEEPLNRAEEEDLKEEEQRLLAHLKDNFRRQALLKAQELAKMTCPKCCQPLRQEVFHDVPIETCPHCSGVWLDAGELELIGQREFQKESWLSKLWRKCLKTKQKSANATPVESSSQPLDRPSP